MSGVQPPTRPKKKATTFIWSCVRPPTPRTLSSSDLRTEYCEEKCRCGRTPINIRQDVCPNCQRQRCPHCKTEKVVKCKVGMMNNQKCARNNTVLEGKNIKFGWNASQSGQDTQKNCTIRDRPEVLGCYCCQHCTGLGHFSLVALLCHLRAQLKIYGRH